MWEELLSNQQNRKEKRNRMTVFPHTTMGRSGMTANIAVHYSAASIKAKSTGLNYLKDVIHKEGIKHFFVSSTMLFGVFMFPWRPIGLTRLCTVLWWLALLLSDSLMIFTLTVKMQRGEPAHLLFYLYLLCIVYFYMHQTVVHCFILSVLWVLPKFHCRNTVTIKIFEIFEITFVFFFNTVYHCSITLYHNATISVPIRFVWMRQITELYRHWTLNYRPWIGVSPWFPFIIN